MRPMPCELTGVPFPENPDGTSPVPLMLDSNIWVKEYAVSQWSMRKGMGYALRAERYRYVEWFTGEQHEGV